MVIALVGLTACFQDKGPELPPEAFASGTDLRGAREEGDVLRVHLETHWDGPATWADSKGSHPFHVDQTWTARQRIEVDEVKRREIRKARVSHEMERVHTRLDGAQRAGQEASAATQMLRGAFQGKTIVHAVDAGLWSIELDKVPAGARPLPLNTTWMGGREAAYPRAAEVGQEWQVDGEALRRWLGVPELTGISGAVSGTLVGIDDVDDESLATITWKGQVHGMLDRGGNGDLRISITGSWKTTRSMDRFIDVEHTGEFSARIEGGYRVGPYWLSSEGSYSGKTVERQELTALTLESM